VNDCNTGYRGTETGCNSKQIFDTVSTVPVSEGMILQLADGSIYASNAIISKSTSYLARPICTKKYS
jgi:hypothetical protein